MTSQTRHAPLPRTRDSVLPTAETDATARSVPASSASRGIGSVSWVAAAIPYLVVLVCTVAGVYIAWHQGSNGGGQGGVIVGSALLAAAVVRLVLPRKLSGLLAIRHRVTDVLTLTAFGASLLAAGLVLPRLGPLSAQRRTAGPR
jgi:hypothetical protein